MTSDSFHELFGGPPREPESEVTQRDMDLARSVQDVTEEIMFRMTRHVRKESGEKNLCLAGGVALNCVANGKILRDRIFDQIWIQPAAGDAGGALGAALFAWHQVQGNPRRATPHDRQKGSYLGPAFDKDDILSWAEMNEYPCRDLGESVFLETAELLASEKIVGWFNGRMEFGPRALGGRSIIGDPRSPAMQSVMNLKIKFRESFRPFAPSCLLEDVSEFFELDQASPYMLLVAPVVESRRLHMDQSEDELFGIDKLKKIRSDLPAVTHVDYSARVQTVEAEDNSAYHSLIKAFKKRTGYGVIINTSFNVRGEPIVCTPEDAYLCFMRTEMDALVIEGILFEKKTQPSLGEDVNWRELYALD